MNFPMSRNLKLVVGTTSTSSLSSEIFWDAVERVPTRFGRSMLRNVSVACVLILLAGIGASAAEHTNSAFRVMTYNIHHGEGLDKKVDLERIADLIKQEKADIVALQEVDKGVERTAKRDLPAEFAKLTGMTCVFSNNYHFQDGEYGNAVLTRFPVTSWTNTHYKMLRPGEQRGILQLALKVHGRELIFIDTHIDFRADDSERLINVDQINGLLPQYAGKPLIMCGDFNDTPGSRTYEKVAANFTDSWKIVGVGDGFSIPAEDPRKRIDYLWILKGSPIVPVKIWVPESEASDHRPVVAEFRFQ